MLAYLNSSQPAGDDINSLARDGQIVKVGQIDAVYAFRPPRLNCSNAAASVSAPVLRIDLA
jgi:hypothetical protein